MDTLTSDHNDNLSVQTAGGCRPPATLNFKLKKYGYLKETKYLCHVVEGKTFTGCGRHCYSGLLIDVRFNSDGMSRVIQFRCFYRGVMYPVKEMQFDTDGSFSVSIIEMDLDGLGVRDVSPDSEHVDGIMQFCGLYDKNGTPIFEGDLLRFYDKTVAVIVFESFGGWCFKWIDKTYKMVRQQNPEPIFRNINLFEVAGNIYQNPKLIEP